MSSGSRAPYSRRGTQRVPIVLHRRIVFVYSAGRALVRLERFSHSLLASLSTVSQSFGLTVHEYAEHARFRPPPGLRVGLSRPRRIDFRSRYVRDFEFRTPARRGDDVSVECLENGKCVPKTDGREKKRDEEDEDPRVPSRAFNRGSKLARVKRRNSFHPRFLRTIGRAHGISLV